MRELVVPTDAGGIDLFIGRTRMRVAGRTTDSPITINGTIPGPILRMREGQEVVIRVHNRLRDEDTSIHWHGLIVPMDMDGVPGVSFAGIKPGKTFEYRFPVNQNGTYWYHSHSGLQEQLGHYGALIVDPAEPEPFTYDVEHTVILSDWTYENPYRLLEKLKTINGYSNYQRQSVADLVQRAEREGWGKTLGARLEFDRMRMDQTDIADLTGAIMTYLMNGRSSRENWTTVAKPGERVRLRLINAATTTFFDFRIPGLPLTVVAADGQYLKPVETDELRIAVAETYDVLVTLPDDRAYTMFAETMDRSGHARGTLAPRAGVSAAIPPKRERPLLGMIDMGMAGMEGMGDKPKPPATGEADMKGMDTAPKPSGPGAAAAPAPAGHDMAGMPGMNAKPEMPAMPGMNARPPAPSGGGLPTENLPMSFTHSDDNHGRDNSQVAMMAQRRFAEPGNGLGKDGWRVLTYADLRALRTYPDRRAPDREFDLHLTGNMTRFIWGMDGKKFSDADMIRFKYGERVRMNMINDTMMAHPMHLHGMWMDLYAGGTLADHPRKHTVAVKPGELLTVDITADAPGHWAFHCHLLYHMDAGMFRTIAVVRSLEEGSRNA
jgi:CopA family copper-resistance protein